MPRIRTNVGLTAGLLFGIMITGCKTRSLLPYVSPRVTGRVVSAEEHEPLSHVLVTRGPLQPDRLSEPRKGGEIMMEKSGVRTDDQGRFVLGSERALTPFRVGWHSVQLSFELAGYQTFRTNYSITSPAATNSLSGEPLVNTGDIPLTPAAPNAPERLQ